MRLFVFLTVLIVCIIAVYAAQQQNQGNKRNQLAKKKANDVLSLSSLRNRNTNRARRIKPSIARRPKKVVRRVVKKSSRRSGAKKLTRKNARGNVRRNSRKRLAKQELSDPNENKSLGAGQATSNADNNKPNADKPASSDAAPAESPVSVPKPASPAAPAIPAVPAVPASPASDSSLASPVQGKSIPSNTFNLPKNFGSSATGAGFAQSSNGGTSIGLGFAQVNGKQSSAGGIGSVQSSPISNDSEPAAEESSFEM